ncbi:MAG: ArnT family glycosyltransferase, partial [Nitrososphaerales archaeon]
ALTGAARDPFATGWATHPTLQFFLNAGLVQVFGRTALAMRMPAAVMGVLAVAAIYLFARAGYGRRVALIAGVLAVASDVLIQFSRLGINNISDTLFMAWTLAGLWIAASTGRPGAYAAAGVGLGLGQYYYFGARAIPFVVAANLLVWLLADRKGVFRSWRLLLGFVLVTLAVVRPLAGHWLRSPGSVTEHMFLTAPFSAGIAEQAAHLGLTPLGVWARHVTQSLGVFTVVPDQGSFYHPERPLLDALQAPFFLVGLFAMLLAIRRPIHQAVLVSGSLVLLLGSVLMNDPAAFHRLLGIMPFVISVVAVGVDAVASLAVSVLKECEDPARARIVRRAMVAALTGLMAVATLNFYFRTYPGTIAYKPPNQTAVSLAAVEYAADGGQGRYFLCTADGVDPAGKVYHTPLAYVSGGQVTGCAADLVSGATSDPRLVFYFLTDQFSLEPEISRRFPGGTYTEYHRPNDGLLIMTRYVVTRQ